jgi:alpha-tubulin suppressor-like RCC1 family protein
VYEVDVNRAEPNSKEILGLNEDVMRPELTEITQMTQGDNHILLLNTKGDVFAFGDNSHGQLGLTPEKKSVDFQCMGPNVYFF